MPTRLLRSEAVHDVATSASASATHASRGPRTTPSSTSSVDGAGRQVVHVRLAARRHPDPELDAGHQRSGAEPGHHVVAARPEDRGHVHPAAHRDVGPQPGRRHPQAYDGPRGRRDDGEGADLAPVDADRGGGAGDAEPDRSGDDLDLEAAEGHLQGGGVLGVGQRPVRQAQGGPVGGTGAADADARDAAPAEVLDQAERSGPQHAEPPAHEPAACTNRTAAPGRSRAGGSRSRSHICRSVVPISCQPPGDSRG